MLVLVALMIAAFFIKNVFFAEDWSYVAMVGSCCFLLLQSLAISVMAESWNESIKNEIDPDAKSCNFVNIKAGFWLLFFNSGTIALIVVIYTYFTCDENTTASTLAGINLALVLLVQAIAWYATLKSARNVSNREDPIARVGLLQPAIVGFFMSYQTWSAVSETTDLCPSANSTLNAIDGRPEADMHANSTVVTMVGMAGVVMVVVYLSQINEPSRADKDGMLENAEDGSNTSGQQVVDDEKVDIRYSWWRFHLILACGALYVASVITNWGYVQAEIVEHVVNASLTVTVELGTAEMQAARGEAPVWIQACFSWLTCLFYLLWAIPPILCQDRDWDTPDSSNTSQV
jgi:hypothetical protein